METLFLFCALIGGTLLTCQFLMTLTGLGDFSAESDIGHDLTLDHDFSGTVETNSGESLPLDEGGDAVDGTDAHHVSWLVGIVSFRTLVAAVTFFGLGGMVANRGGNGIPEQFSFAFLCGTSALFAVHWIMRSLHQLGESGTLLMANAIGSTARVTVPIPGGHAGSGKVLLEIQGRLEELPATTHHALTLHTGSCVVVQGIESHQLEVEPFQQNVSVAEPGLPAKQPI